jgi:uncharacterized protein
MKPYKGCGVAWIAWVLLIIGGLNWGLVGIGGFANSNWNVVNLLLGAWPAVEWIVYILVGISALAMLFGCRCKKCSAMKAAMTQGDGMKNDKMGM